MILNLMVVILCFMSGVHHFLLGNLVMSCLSFIIAIITAIFVMPRS
jgi:uncharacterized membrane protein YqaE (UPF0057 family)